MSDITALLNEPGVLEAALNGDEEIHNQLYKEIERYIHYQKRIWVAKLFNGDPSMNDEVLGEINLAYILALTKYDPYKASFVSFLHIYINSHMIMYYRRHIKKLKGIYIDYLDREIGQTDGSCTLLIDLIPVQEDKLLNIALDELWHEVNNVNLAHPKYGNLILLKLQGLTISEIAKKVGISDKSNAHRVLSKQIKTLANILQIKGMYNVKLADLKHRCYTEEEIKLICELRKTLTPKEIGEKFNVSGNAISCVLRRRKALQKNS